MGLKKFVGSLSPPLGAPSPLELFLDFRNLGNVVYFVDIFERFVGPLDVMGVEFRSP